MTANEAILAAAEKIISSPFAATDARRKALTGDRAPVLSKILAEKPELQAKTDNLVSAVEIALHITDRAIQLAKTYFAS